MSGSRTRHGAWGALTTAALLSMLFAVRVAAAEPPAASPKTVALSPKALATMQRLPIQHNGRVKPFDSFARETLASIAGSSRIHGQDAVVTALSMIADPDAWQDEPLVAVPFRPLREKLGMDVKQARISYNDLVASRKLMRMLPDIVQKQQREEKLSMLEQETMDAFERFTGLSMLLQQKLTIIPPPAGSSDVWLPVLAAEAYPADRQAAFRAAWTHFLDEAKANKGAAIEATAAQLAQTLRAANPSAYPADWRLTLEIAYNHVTPFRLARIFYLVAFMLLLLGLSPARRWAGSSGMGALIAAFVLHGTNIAIRVILGGRPPVANFYETMFWLPFVAVAISLIFAARYRVRYFGIASSVVAAVMLTLADVVPLDSSISPVVAVLRSNFWLTIHVLTIVASYGALALATVLAHVYAVSFLARRSADAQESLELFLYRSLQVGIVLLAAGIMLGAVWANASWGRYWGWDPKETWALITLLWFLAMLHGRFAGWLKGVGLALGTITGFFLLIMTYYGVSFYLVGLHSYAGGHAKPIPPLLIGFLLAEVAFVMTVALSVARRQRLA